MAPTIDFTQILITVISTAGAVICAYIGKKVESGGGEPTSPGVRRSIRIWAGGMWLAIAIALINTGILVWRLWRPSPPTEVTITYPADLSEVEQSETIRGTVQGLPEGHVIWVVVFVQEVGRYYPQDRPVELEANGEWSLLAYIGVSFDIGKKFDILAVVADTKAQSAFSAYLLNAKERNEWSGLERLPEGATIYDRVTVTRK